MPKPSKKAMVVATRPISDFFTRKYAAGPPPIAKSISGQRENANPVKVFNSPPEKSVSISSTSIPSATKSSITISDASSPATPRISRPFTDSVEIASPNKSTKGQFLMPPTAIPSSNDPDSVKSRTGSLSPHPSYAKSRNPIFDSDSDVEMPAPSVYVQRLPVRPVSAPSTALRASMPLRATKNLTATSQIRTNSKKKQRLSPSEPGTEPVPTSQSDELEMDPLLSPQRDHRQVKRSVDEWRHKAVSAPSLSSEDISDESRDLPTFIFESTPPPSDIIHKLSPLPPSPQILDPSTKAERIIAEIKARAYAETMQNRPETPIREFKDELSDSDDDALPDSPMKGKGKGKAIGSTLQHNASTNAPSRRYGFRNRDVSPSPSAPKKSSSYPVLTKRPFAGRAKGQAKAYNPLDDLLKEKKRDDRRGKGSEALRQAEAALANRDVIMYDEDGDFTSEAAARKAVVERKRLALKSSSPGGYDASDGDDVNDIDRQRLLGEERGKAVASLLIRDKASRQKEKEIEKPVGIPFWRVYEKDAQEDMNVEQTALPKLDAPSPHPLISMLQGAIERNDFQQASLMIDSGAISFYKSTEDASVVSYLCELALLSYENILHGSAIRALNRIWEISLRPVPGISFSCILSTLTRLGAQPSILNVIGWNVPTMDLPSICLRKQDSVLYRLIALITASARFRRLSNEEIPDILMAIILVANDTSSSHELQCEIALSINEICGSIASGGDISASVESLICTKVLQYLSTVEPVNKAYITNLFGSGIGRTRRIGRWIAHAIITNKLTISPTRYSDLPPILPILGEFTRQRTKSMEISGKFELHDKTDFVDMAFYVQILGVAVTNVLGYVMEERKVQPQDPPLLLLRTAIEGIHSRISDIRATHLDRSRTKAALKELSLRIHYQRQVAQQSSRTLHTYFSKNKKPKGVSP